MRKIFKTFLFLFIGILSLFMNSKVYAYMVSSNTLSNSFTTAPLYTDTFIVNLEDDSGNITEIGREEKKYFENRNVEISNPTFVDVSNYELQSITINGSGSYNIGDSFVQTPNNTTIVYTYKNTIYSISYTGDTSNYTYSNTNLSVISNQSYTTNITPNTGRDIDTVTVTMDGVDISNKYSNNTLNIESVTGNVEINVTTKTKVYTITYSDGNYSHSNNATTIEHGSSFTTNITATGNGIISGVTVTMGGTDITNTAVSNNNTITINNVTGDIDITVRVTPTCLVEGTNITMYDGTTKRIEDVRYNDLIKVWNHDTGSFGFEYAGWIEKSGTASSYTKITFSDGTVLKIVGGHSLFSKRLNKYVDVLSGDLKVGDEVVKLKDDIKYVKIKSIETVNEEVKYYHVISTRYFNIIANDILTTYEIFDNISNFMDFGQNLKWKNTKVVRSDMYTYKDFNYLPRYIYKAFRLEETKYLVNNNLVSLEQLKYLFNNYLTNNDKLLIPPTNSSGKRLWMVTTSDDSDLSNKKYQLEEGSIYVVPEPKKKDKFVNWYNHSDNKYYNPGDKIEVYSGMHLTAIYEE